jgi:hypothetical protein
MSSFRVEKEGINGQDQTYSLDNLVYPIDLESNPAFDGNKVLFFINVSTASKQSGVNTGSEGYTLLDIPKAELKTYSGTRVLGEVEGALGTEFSAANKKRLSAAIALHLPTAIQQSTSVSWGEEDMSGTADILLSAGIAAVEAAKSSNGAVDTVTNTLGAAAKAGTAGSIAAYLKSSTTAQAVTRITQGNARAEMLFKEVDFRTFSFSYSFAPKSSGEAENVMRIIRMFKHHMLPEYKDKTKFLFIYPSEFNIKYYKGTAENKYIEKQITAVLKSVAIDYTPNGQYNSFSSGMAQQINMALEFMEIGLPTKETSPYNAHGV